MVLITFKHARSCFKKGQILEELKDAKFVGFDYGYYAPSFKMTDKQYRRLPKKIKDLIVEKEEA